MGELVSITVKPEGVEPPERAYLRLPVETATLVAGYGIEGDTKGGREDRHLNILCSESLQELTVDGYLTKPGQIGEQLIIKGVPAERIENGAVLQIGPEARVRMVQPRTGCDRFEKYQSKSREGAAGRLGMMAQVETGGSIRVGDPVLLVESG